MIEEVIVILKKMFFKDWIIYLWVSVIFILIKYFFFGRLIVNRINGNNNFFI